MALSRPLVSASVKANWPEVDGLVAEELREVRSAGRALVDLGRPSFDLTMPAVIRFPTSR